MAARGVDMELDAHTCELALLVNRADFRTDRTQVVLGVVLIHGRGLLEHVTSVVVLGLGFSSRYVIVSF